MNYYPARVTVDLGAIRSNIESVLARTDAQVMAVVKADAYGHGLIPVARNAVAAGATWLGTAQLSEALALRSAGLTCRILGWLYGPGAPLAQCITADIDLSVSALWALEEVCAASREVGGIARIHLKVDSGMARGGARAEEFQELVAAAVQARLAGEVEIVGVWSHLACADTPDHPANADALRIFTAAVEEAEQAGVELEVRHVANSAATLLSPQFHFDLVRLGIAAYGQSPAPRIASSSELGLRPAMALSADLALVKRVGAGQGVSYDLTYVTEQETKLGVVPLGYGDGIPRHASNAAEVLVADERARIAGRVCMDQFVVDLGASSPAEAGSEVLLFGSGASGEPTAQDWAEAAETINYEIVTRTGARIPRVYINDMS